MAQHDKNRPIDDAVELLKTNGFDGLADVGISLLRTFSSNQGPSYHGISSYLSQHRTQNPIAASPNLRDNNLQQHVAHLQQWLVVPYAHPTYQTAQRCQQQPRPVHSS